MKPLPVLTAKVWLSFIVYYFKAIYVAVVSSLSNFDKHFSRLLSRAFGRLSAHKTAGLCLTLCGPFLLACPTWETIHLATPTNISIIYGVIGAFMSVCHIKVKKQWKMYSQCMGVHMFVCQLFSSTCSK